MGFHPHPVRGDWYVHYDCNKPARTYLNAKEEQGDLWNDGVVLVQAPAKRLVRRRPS